MLWEKYCAIVVTPLLVTNRRPIKTVLKVIKSSGSVKSNTMNKK